jgi:hypothetical protein
MSKRLDFSQFTTPIQKPCADLLWHQILESSNCFSVKNTKEYRAATKAFYEHLAAYTKNVSYLEALGMMQTDVVVPQPVKAAKVLIRKDVSPRRQGDDEDGTIELTAAVVKPKTPRKRSPKPAAQEAVADAPAARAKSPASKKRGQRVSQ